MEQLTPFFNNHPYIKIVFIILAIISFLGGVFSSWKLFSELFLSKPELVAKINESYSNSGKEGNIYLFNVSVVNIGDKDFYPKTWNVKLKYIGENNFIDVKVAPMRYMEMDIEDVNSSSSNKKRLRTEKINFIQSYPIIKKGELIVGYLAFIVTAYNEDKGLDTVIIDMTDFNNEKKEITVDYKNLKPEDLFFDDSIWE